MSIETQPRIFVGTLASGEAEFKQSQKMIVNQLNVSVYHHVIEGLSEAEAHLALWQAWESSKSKFDLFVKVDADTVLISKYALLKIYQVFQSNSRITGMQIPLLDYFTGRLINGLNAFSPKVQFRTAQSDLYCDRADYGHDIVLRGRQVKDLTPIAYHSVNPHPRQAFRYGFHRAFKRQWWVIKWVYFSYLLRGGVGRRWALLGVICALKMDDNTVTSYKDQVFETLFLGWEKKPAIIQWISALMLPLNLYAYSRRKY